MRKVKLGEVMTLHRGYDLPSSRRVEGPYPVVGSSGISSFHQDFKVGGPNVVTGRYGTIGKVFYSDNAVWPLNTTLYVSDFHGNNPRYIAYLLEIILRVMPLDGTDKSTVPGIDRNTLHALLVPLHNRQKQSHIASVIQQIDDKIANDKKLMAELEETARLIYDYWFTQFDFPDENGHPYRSSGGAMIYNETLKREIPVGWEAVNVASMVSVTKGVSYKSEDLLGDGIPMVNLASFEIGGGFKVSGTKSYSGKVDSRRTAVPGDLLMCVTQQTALDLTGKTNVLGKAFRLPDCFATERVVISTDVVKLISADAKTGVFLECLFARPEVHKRIVGFANGTKIKHLDVEGALDFVVAMPSPNGVGGRVLDQYALFADDVHAKMSRLIRENEELLTLRNRLLPMLMNGQVEVRGVVGLSGDGARS